MQILKPRLDWKNTLLESKDGQGSRLCVCCRPQERAKRRFKARRIGFQSLVL